MNENKNIKNEVLDKIKAGEINMRPKFYFLLNVIALIVIAVLALVTSSMLVSFIVFSLMASGKMFLLGFGLRGFMMFFVLFPWPLLIIEVAFIVLLEWLLKKFKFGYRTSFSRLIIAILAISLVVSAIITLTPIHNNMLRRAEKKDLPIFGDYYRGIRRPAKGTEVFRGVVSSVGTSSFVLDQQMDGDVDSDDRVQSYLINLPQNISQENIPGVGEVVFVGGKLMPDNTVQAYGFKKLQKLDVE